MAHQRYRCWQWHAYNARSHPNSGVKQHKYLGEGPSVTFALLSASFTSLCISAADPLIGFPSVGKSRCFLLSLTLSVQGSYEFTTLTCIPGVVEYRGVKLQLLDLPGIIEGASEGRGRGRQVIAEVVWRRVRAHVTQEVRLRDADDDRGVVAALRLALDAQRPGHVGPGDRSHRTPGRGGAARGLLPGNVR